MSPQKEIVDGIKICLRRHTYGLMSVPIESEKNWEPTFVPFAKTRKRIETSFLQLADLFVIIRNYTKITTDLFA